MCIDRIRDYEGGVNKWRKNHIAVVLIVDGIDRAGMRAHLKAIGLLTDSELSKPFIGVVNSWNEMHPGHKHLREVAQAVKDGIRMAGGVPFEFNTISICDGIAQGHVGMCYVLPSREVIADSAELMVRRSTTRRFSVYCRLR
jgi:dihydroxy-acid dehydratase